MVFPDEQSLLYNHTMTDIHPLCLNAGYQLMYEITDSFGRTTPLQLKKTALRPTLFQIGALLLPIGDCLLS